MKSQREHAIPLDTRKTNKINHYMYELISKEINTLDNE